MKWFCWMILTLVLGTAKSQSVYQNVKIDDKVQGFGPCEPTIAINPADPNSMVAGSVINRVYTTNNGGLTWKNGTLSSTYGVFGDPCIVADMTGNFYYFHLADPTKEGRQGNSWLDRMVCQKSTDQGRNWNNGSFTGLNGHKQQDKEWAAVDPENGNIYLTWTEFDAYGSNSPTDSTVILFSKSDDQATTWTRPIRINQYAGNCLDDDGTVEGAVPAVGPDGQIYVAWSLDEKIYFDKSNNYGETWLSEDIIVGDQPAGWSFEIPGLSRANGMPIVGCDISSSPYRGNIYVNWADQRNGEGNTDIWLSKSNDDGTSWDPAVKVNDDSTRSDQFFTWMSVDPTTGYIYIVFYDRRNYEDFQTDVFLAWSNDGGDSFINERISESPFTPSKEVFFGDYNNISSFGGMVRPIWTRAEGINLSVWTAIIDHLEK